MGDITAISWADKTFNPWEGCQKVGPGCDHCYAEARNSRFGGGVAQNWGPGAERRRTSAGNWRKPVLWDKEAAEVARVCAANGVEILPTFVFCASLADVFDNAVPPQWRRDLFDLIRKTPHLTWLLLTKRPGNIVKMYQDQQWSRVPADQDTIPIPSLTWPRNAAIGCTVVNQTEAERDIPKLLEADAALDPAFSFLSMEPLLGPVNLTRLDTGAGVSYDGGPLETFNALDGQFLSASGAHDGGYRKVDWVITGGESGPKARPAEEIWFLDLLDQCSRHGTAFQHKQNGGRRSDKGGNLLAGRVHHARPELRI